MDLKLDINDIKKKYSVSHLQQDIIYWHSNLHIDVHVSPKMYTKNNDDQVPRYMQIHSPALTIYLDTDAISRDPRTSRLNVWLDWVTWKARGAVAKFHVLTAAGTPKHWWKEQKRTAQALLGAVSQLILHVSGFTAYSKWLILSLESNFYLVVRGYIHNCVKRLGFVPRGAMNVCNYIWLKC